MGVQKIKAPNGDSLVVLPESEYDALLDRLDDAAAVLAVERVESRLVAGEEEFVPEQVLDRLLSGESKVTVWREHRGLAARELAQKAGITQAYLSQIETGKRDGTVSTMKKIAQALSITLDELA